MPLLLTGVVFLVAILLRQVVPLNTDVSWLLVVCERMLDGQHLYRDIIEINPPMAAFAYLPGVALARVLGVDPRHVIDAQLLLLAAASLFAVSRILRLSPSLSPLNWGPLAIWAAAVVTILPMHVFAQREHMAMLTFLPALAVYAMRSNREPLPLWAILIAGVGAGITLAFKPFFTVPAALCILFAADPFALLAHAVCAGEHHRGRAGDDSQCRHVHLLPRVFHGHLSAGSRHLSVVVDAGFGHLPQRRHAGVRDRDGVGAAGAAETERPTRCCWSRCSPLGFAVSFFLQRRGWAYHSYPMVAVALLAMGYALTGASGIALAPW